MAMWLSLIRDRVVEAEAVIGRRRRRAPRISRSRARAASSCGCRRCAPSCGRPPREPRCRARDAAHPADEIERDALGGQHAPRRPFDRRDASARRNRRAVLGESLEADRRVDQAESERGEIEAGDDALLSGGHHGLRLEVARHDGIGREVSGAAEVLEQRLADDRLDENAGSGASGMGQALRMRTGGAKAAAAAKASLEREARPHPGRRRRGKSAR